MESHSERLPKNTQSTPELMQTTFQTFFDTVFSTMNDSIILCDNEGLVLHMNTAALHLFHMPANSAYKTMTALEIFRQYTWYDSDGQPLPLDQFLLTTARTLKFTNQQECRTVTLGKETQKKTFQQCSSLMLGPQSYVSGILYIFHDITEQQQKEKQKDLLNQSITTLIRAALSMPELLNSTFDQETPSIPQGIETLAQHLVDVTRQLLECERVLLLGMGPDKRISYVSTSGLTHEQKLRRIEINGQYSIIEFFGDKAVARFYQKEYDIARYDDVPLPFKDYFTFDPQAVLLATPIFQAESLIGFFVSTKNDPSYHYTEEEIFFTQSISDFLTLLLISMQKLCKFDKRCANTLIHNEANVLIESFLNSASHELRTPLTVVTGNVQLAQRRLQALLGQLATHSEQSLSDEFTPKMERVEQLLRYADQSANRLNVLLDTIIADVQIHQGKFTLTTNNFHLDELLKEVVERQQKQNLEVDLQLQIVPHTQGLLLADQRRIEQVITIYIINAITRTPPNQAVIIHTEQTQETVRVSVIDKGSAIPLERQKDIWERFSHPWEDKPTVDSNWNLGLGLSLCREIIRAHQGQVGLQSDQEHGTTFWFTLPIPQNQ